MTTRPDTPEFTGRELLDLVVSIEAAVGSHRAGSTPLGRAVIGLAERTLEADPEARRLLNREPEQSAITPLCPRPVNAAPEGKTAKDCIWDGECGCDSVKDERERCAACVPTTWLDPLLSVPNKEFSDGPSVERLLKAIAERIRALAPPQGTDAS